MIRLKMTQKSSSVISLNAIQKLKKSKKFLTLQQIHQKIRFILYKSAHFYDLTALEETVKNSLAYEI